MSRRLCCRSRRPSPKRSWLATVTGDARIPHAVMPTSRARSRASRSDVCRNCSLLRPVAHAPSSLDACGQVVNTASINKARPLHGSLQLRLYVLGKWIMSCPIGCIWARVASFQCCWFACTRVLIDETGGVPSQISLRCMHVLMYVHLFVSIRTLYWGVKTSSSWINQGCFAVSHYT